MGFLFMARLVVGVDIKASLSKGFKDLFFIFCETLPLGQKTMRCACKPMNCSDQSVETDAA